MSLYYKVRPANLLAQAGVKVAAAARGFSDYLSYSKTVDPDTIHTTNIYDSGESSDDDEVDFMDASDTFESSEAPNEVAYHKSNISPNYNSNSVSNSVDPPLPSHHTVPEDDIQRRWLMMQQKNKDLDAQEQAMIAQEREENLARLQKEERKVKEKEERLQRRRKQKPTKRF